MNKNTLPTIVVLGAGYAGAKATQRLNNTLDLSPPTEIRRPHQETDHDQDAVPASTTTETAPETNHGRAGDETVRTDGRGEIETTDSQPHRINSASTPPTATDDADAHLVWVSDTATHFVLHESHRIIRDPSVAQHLSVPVDTIAPDAHFLNGRVEEVTTDDRTVHLADGRTVTYDYCLVALGSETAFYGIDGLNEYAHTLKRRSDALAIHDDLHDTVAEATPEDPARVAIGGAGLTGIQIAGEVAAFPNPPDQPIDVHLFEANDTVFAGHPDRVQAALSQRLEQADVTVETGVEVSAVTADAVQFADRNEFNYDVFVWAGGVAGGNALTESDVECDDLSGRVIADQTFKTSDDSVFTVGDAALINGATADGPAPPTAQAAWQAGVVVADNIAHAHNGEPLEEWSYEDKGTLISVGDDAVAHDVAQLPVDTFGSLPAKFLKKFVAAQWLADMDGWKRGLAAWRSL